MALFRYAFPTRSRCIPESTPSGDGVLDESSPSGDGVLNETPFTQSPDRIPTVATKAVAVPHQGMGY